MASAIFPLGNSIVQAIGLRDSMLPSAVVNEIANQLSKSYKISVGVSTQQAVCGGGERLCCDIIVEKDKDNKYISPHATGGTKSDVKLSIGIPGLANLTVAISLEIAAQVIQHDLKGNCPELCVDESIIFTVDVEYKAKVEISGRLERAKSAAGGLISAVPDVVNFGPQLGSNDVSNDILGSGGDIDGSVKSEFTTHVQHRFRANCESVELAEIPELASAPSGGSSVALLEDDEEDAARSCTVNISVNDIRGRNVSAGDTYDITIDYFNTRSVISATVDANGDIDFNERGDLKRTYPGQCGKTVNPRLNISVRGRRATGETGTGLISQDFPYDCTENGSGVFSSRVIPVNGPGFKAAVQLKFFATSSCGL